MQTPVDRAGIGPQLNLAASPQYLTRIRLKSKRENKKKKQANRFMFGPNLGGLMRQIIF